MIRVLTMLVAVSLALALLPGCTASWSGEISIDVDRPPTYVHPQNEAPS